MLYTSVVAYDPERVSPEEAAGHVRDSAKRLFPEADGFDHASLHPFMPGREERLANGQRLCVVKVDCRRPDPA